MEICSITSTTGNVLLWSLIRSESRTSPLKHTSVATSAHRSLLLVPSGRPRPSVAGVLRAATQTLVERPLWTSWYLSPGHAGSPNPDNEKISTDPEAREAAPPLTTTLSVRWEVEKNKTNKTKQKNSSIINILNVKSCYAWDTRTVQRSWHAHTHTFKRSDIQEDALTLWGLFCSSYSSYSSRRGGVVAYHFTELTELWKRLSRVQNYSCLMQLHKFASHKGLKGIWRDVAFFFFFACGWGLLSDLLSEDQVSSEEEEDGDPLVNACIKETERIIQTNTIWNEQIGRGNNPALERSFWREAGGKHLLPLLFWDLGQLKCWQYISMRTNSLQYFGQKCHLDRTHTHRKCHFFEAGAKFNIQWTCNSGTFFDTFFSSHWQQTGFRCNKTPENISDLYKSRQAGETAAMPMMLKKVEV